jgi:type I restriction enzyme, S subunit
VSLNLDRSGWKRVRLGEVIRRSRKQVNPIEAGTERYVAGGHINSDSLTIDRWGDPRDGQMGSTFRYVFEPNQVLFVSARPYLRKTGIVDFSGVVADKTYVLDAIPENGLIQQFLPLVLSSDSFVDYATTEATGSMNPRLLWGPLQRYEFDLPTVGDQKRVADLVWAVERHLDTSRALLNALLAVTAATFEEASIGTASARLDTWVTRIDAGRSPRAAGVPATADELGVLKVSAVGRDGFEPGENKRLLNADDFRPEDVVRAGDLLVTRANAVVDNVARPAMVDRDYPNLMLSDKTLRLVPKAGYGGRVILAALRSPAYRSYVRESVNGTEAKNISQAKILAGPVPKLSTRKVGQLNERLALLDAAVVSRLAMLASITALKSALFAEVFGGI